MMSDSNRLARKNKLDDAIRDYFQAGVDDGSLDSGGYVVGWTVAIAATRIIGGKEADGFIVEQSPGMNNFTAAGLAVAAAGAFENQLYDPVVDQD